MTLISKLEDRLKEKIIAVVFLIFIYYMGFTILYEANTSAENVDKLSKISEESGYISILEEKIDEVNKIYVHGLENHDKFISLWAMTNIAIGKQVFDDASYGYVIRDSQGKLHLQDKDIAEEEMKKYSDSMFRLYQRLEDKKIAFSYIQAPYKAIENYTLLPRGIELYGNKKSDTFLSQLADKDVPCRDIRKWVKDDNIDKADMFFKTDHHWKTETAFWAYQKIFDFLKIDMKLSKLDDFYRNRQNFSSDTYENCFLGSTGRRVGKDISGLDDYTYIYPNFDTDYDVYNMLNDENHPFKSGNFRESIEVSNLLTSEDYNSNRYSTYFQWDYGNLIIRNKKVDNGYKVLLVKDSYSLPLAAFLSTAVSELHMIDMREATDIDIANYSEKHDIDAVIVMYSSGAFKDEMFSFGKQQK